MSSAPSAPEGQEQNVADLRDVRRQVLKDLGTRFNAPDTDDAIDEALAYGENPFLATPLTGDTHLPLAEEPHVAWWRPFADAPAGTQFCALAARLPQLRVPLRRGVSTEKHYQECMAGGADFDAVTFGGVLELEQPQQLRIIIRPSLAGALPVLSTDHRPDFVRLLQALVHRHEPRDINPSVSAQMVGGFLNVERLREYRAHWKARMGAGATDVLWSLERARLRRQEPWRIYDRFIVVARSPYGGAAPSALGLDYGPEEWLEKSSIMRLEHEFTHYLTRRLYGTMRLNLLDELICDWAGFTRALGTFKARWFLRALGLIDPRDIHPDSRVHAYRGGLSDAAYIAVCGTTICASTGLEQLTERYLQDVGRERFLLALTRMTTELLAADSRETYFKRALDEAAAVRLQTAPAT